MFASPCRGYSVGRAGSDVVEFFTCMVSSLPFLSTNPPRTTAADGDACCGGAAGDDVDEAGEGVSTSPPTMEYDNIGKEVFSPCSIVSLRQKIVLLVNASEGMKSINEEHQITRRQQAECTCRVDAASVSLNIRVR